MKDEVFMQIERYDQSISFDIGSLNRIPNVFEAQFDNSDTIATATAGIFAADIVNRIGKGSHLVQVSEAEAIYKELGKNASRSSAGLQASLENMINSITQRHGTGAATAVMGIVAQNVGNNASEESLSQGFMEAIKFIDRNYGISEGNLFMGELNESVNKEMNKYFDNGTNEVFFDLNTQPNAMRMVKGITESTDGMFDGLAERTSFEIDGGLSAKEMREITLEAQAKRILASGKLPPAYLQEYLPAGAMPATVPGGLLNTII